MFLKVIAVTEAVVTRDGQVRAAGRPYDHATLGPLEDWLGAQTGPGVIDGIAGRAALDMKHVKGRYRRLLSAAFMIRVLVLQTLMPGAQLSDVITALDGEALTIGTARPLVVNSFDGSLLRVPDTLANQAAFGSVGTADDSAAWPCVRLFPLNDCFTRSLLAMPWGPAGSDKTASEQRLLDAVIRDYPHVLAKNQAWLLDRLWHGAGRLAALAQRTHFLARLKSDIELKMVSEILPDGPYRAEVSGDGVTMEVRVIVYYADVEGQEVPEMFCLITDLLDWQEYPAIEQARLYKWRWDGSETALREAKAPLHGAGPGTGAMLRSGSPELIAQEIAAWACGTEMTRGVTATPPAPRSPPARDAAPGSPSATATCP